jgi:hypothetical protein
VDGGSTLPSGTAQPDLPPVEAWGESNLRPATREIPVAERRMVLYATQPKTLSPADPCNKVSWCASSPKDPVITQSPAYHDRPHLTAFAEPFRRYHPRRNGWSKMIIKRLLQRPA